MGSPGHFATAATSLSSDPRHSDAAEQAKNIQPPCGTLPQECCHLNSRSRCARCKAAWGGKHSTRAATPFLAVQPPDPFTPNLVHLEHQGQHSNAGSLLKADLRAQSEAVIAIPEGIPQPAQQPTEREIITGEQETGRCFAQKTLYSPSCGRRDPPISSPCD